MTPFDDVDSDEEDDKSDEINVSVCSDNAAAAAVATDVGRQCLNTCWRPYS